jgi:hypothetical protein
MIHTLHPALFLLFFVQPACSEKNAEARDYKPFYEEARRFITSRGYQNDFFFLIDLSRHSGTNRFFVYDLEQNIIVDSALVTHGTCDVFENNPHPHKQAAFSNRENSHCSSKGKYEVGKRDYSSWGIHVKYWLRGLEAQNSNAEKRVVVLHSWSVVPEEETFPQYIANSWGCPAVSDQFMHKLDDMLKQQSLPTLLWIIE